MDATRYSDPQDIEYRAVPDQLWLWVNDIEREIEEEEEKRKAAENAEPVAEEQPERGAHQIENMQDLEDVPASDGLSYVL
jgi:hypothetical protein